MKKIILFTLLILIIISCKTIVPINKTQEQPKTTKPIEEIPEIELIAFNKPLEYLYADGIYRYANARLNIKKKTI